MYQIISEKNKKTKKLGDIKLTEESEIDLEEWEQASTKKMVSYSFGFLLVFFIGGQFNIYVFYYYNVEIGMPIVLLGLAYVIFAIWNAINDPLVGYLTDRPFKWTKKWGMRFPWMIIGAIPFLICWYLIFAVPESIIDQTDPWPIFWYFVIVSCALDTFYSIYTTHISAGFTTHFRTDAERRRASAINNIIPPILALFIGFIVPIFYVYGDRNSMIFAQTWVILMLAIALILTIPGIRESDDLKERFLRGYEETGRDPYWKLMKEAFRRKSFASTLIAFMLLSLGGVLYAATQIFFLKDILGLPYSVVIYNQLASFIGFLGSIPFWANISKKYGHTKLFKLSLLLCALAYSPALWITTLEEAILFSFTGGIAGGAFWISLAPVVADVYDECTISTGKHQEATYEAFRVFFNRLAFAFVGIIIPIGQIITGYNTDPHAKQTDLAKWGIRVYAGLIPALLCLGAFLIIIIWYDLGGVKQETIKKQLKEMGL